MVIIDGTTTAFIGYVLPWGQMSLLGAHRYHNRSPPFPHSSAATPS